MTIAGTERARYAFGPLVSQVALDSQYRQTTFPIRAQLAESCHMLRRACARFDRYLRHCSPRRYARLCEVTKRGH